MTIHPDLAGLAKKIAARTLTLGIIGLGYVGLPLSLTFLRKGVRVIGFDLDQNKIARLAAGESYIKHIPATELAAHVASGHRGCWLSRLNN